MKKLLVTFLVGIISYAGIAQNVGIGTSNPSASAQLDVSSTNSGLLPPRMTYAQRNAIVNPAAGLIVYCTDCAIGEMQYFNGTGWINMSIGAASAPFSTPIISTNIITNISSSGAVSGGNITSNGGTNITARGICWSTSANPTIDLTTKTNDDTGTGEFTSTITGLTPSTTYYVRAYATNSVGIDYGTQQTFTTSNAVANLPSVTIGTQVWTTQNLNVTRYRNGDIIPQVTDPTQWTNLTTGAWCYYNNDPGFGLLLYNWYAVNDPRGLAPSGWHVPSKTEWETLSSYLGGAYLAGNAMKLSSDWDRSGGNNSSGFKALPSGYRTYNGTFADVTLRTHFWTTTEITSLTINHYYLLRDTNSPLSNGNDYKSYGFSVRCIRD